MTHWFHLRCAALKRPSVLRPTLAEATASDTAAIELSVDEVERLTSRSEEGENHRRLPRIDGAERAPSARARCRHCRDTIDRDEWRLRLVYYDEGQFNPSGYIHASCAPAYLEFDKTAQIAERAAHFSAGLDAADLSALQTALQGK